MQITAWDVPTVSKRPKDILGQDLQFYLNRFAQQGGALIHIVEPSTLHVPQHTCTKILVIASFSRDSNKPIENYHVVYRHCLDSILLSHGSQV